MRFPLIPPDLADTHALRPIYLPELTENRPGFFRVVAAVITKENIEIQKLSLRPSVERHMRLRNNDNAGDAALARAGLGKFMEAGGHDYKTGAAHHAKGFYPHFAFIRQERRIAGATMEIGKDVE